jgi:hypothetical protein
MLLPRETEIAKRIRVTVEELQGALARSGQKTGASITNMTVGGAAGASLGILGGMGLASGIVPGAEGIATLGIVVPLTLASASAGVGTILGAFADILPITNVWRRQ